MQIYGSLEDANLFFDEIDIEGLWENYSDEQKIKSLNLATKRIDSLQFQGKKYQYDQKREFPRVIMQGQIYLYWDVDNTNGTIVVPRSIIEATYKQAYLQIKNIDNQTINAQNRGITSISIGSTSESYDINKVPQDPRTKIFLEVMSDIKNYILSGI